MVSILALVYIGLCAENADYYFHSRMLFTFNYDFCNDLNNFTYVCVCFFHSLVLTFVFRHYRSKREETPSHPGGVSKQARDRITHHHQGWMERGMYISSRNVRGGSSQQYTRGHCTENSTNRKYYFCFYYSIFICVFPSILSVLIIDRLADCVCVWRVTHLHMNTKWRLIFQSGIILEMWTWLDFLPHVSCPINSLNLNNTVERIDWSRSVSDRQTHTTVLNPLISPKSGWPDSPQFFDSLVISMKFN